MLEGEGLLLAVKLGAAIAALAQIGRLSKFLFEHRRGKLRSQASTIRSGTTPNTKTGSKAAADEVITMHIGGVKAANYITSSS